MKTVKEWLEELPEGYRELALANAKENCLSNECEDICEALYISFIWRASSEGYNFWNNVYTHFPNGSELPKLPEK